MTWLLASSLIFSTSDSVYELSNMPMMGQKCHCLKYSLCFPERFLNQVDLDDKVLPSTSDTFQPLEGNK